MTEPERQVGPAEKCGFYPEGSEAALKVLPRRVAHSLLS